jgi:outer membrane protein assembly factor BamB
MQQRQKTVVIGLGLVFLAACAGGPDPDRIDQAVFPGEHGWSPLALAAPDILWQTNVGPGHSAVVVDGELLYTMGSRQRGAIFEDVVSCLETATGEVVWEYSYPCDEIYFAGPRTTPALDGKRLYTLSWQGHLHCLDAGNGSLIWSRHIVDDGLGKVGHWGLTGSPVVEGDLLIVSAGRSGAALDKLTSEVRWHSEAVETGLPTPLLFDSDDQRLAGFLHEDELLAVDVASGAVRWTHPWDGKACLPPAQVGHRLLVPGTAASTLLELGNGEPQVVWSSRQARLSEFQSWAILDGHLYGHYRHHLLCVDMATGKRRWRTEIGNNGALSAADGMLIILTGRGELVIAEASPQGYRELSRARVLSMKDNRGVPQPEQHHCWTWPVLADGRIYVRCNHGNLVSVDMRSR